MGRKMETVSLAIEEENGFGFQEIQIVKVNPEELDGVLALWEMVQTAEDELLAKELIDFLSNLYTRPDMDKVNVDDGYTDYMKIFIDKCEAILLDVYSSPDWQQSPQKTCVAKRVLNLLTEIIDKTESKQIVKNLSLSSFYKGKTVSATIENKISTSYTTPKTIDIKVTGNTSIFQIKQMISQQIKRTTWKNIRLVRAYKKVEIPDKANGRNLRDLGVSLGEKLISEYRSSPVRKPESLVFYSEKNEAHINPKAISAFKEVFKMFSNDGRMTPENATKYIEGVLDERNIPVDYFQIIDLFAKYDTEKKGYLTESDFVKFYTEASYSKPTAVSQNLKNLNFNDQLMKADDKLEVQVEELARAYILSKEQLVSTLYKMLGNDCSLSGTAWTLLSRLPPIQEVLNRILSLDGLKSSEKGGWETLIEQSSTYKALYSLYIIDYLLSEEKSDDSESPISVYTTESPNEFKKNWKKEFINYGGYSFLVHFLTNLQSNGCETQSEILMFNFVLRAVKNYLLASLTIEKPDMYKNVAYIGSSNITFSALTGHSKHKKVDTQAISKPEISEIPVETPVVVPPLTMDSANCTDVVIYGPANKNDAGNETSPLPKSEKSLDQLVEKPEFLEFRENLRTLGNYGLKSENSVEIIRFLVRLCEMLMMKTENHHFEEITIIETSLSIIFCLILTDLELLKRLVTSEEIKLLGLESTFKIEGRSDFISFFLAGLLTTRGYIFIRYFDNAFKVLLRESGSVEVQNILVQIVLENTIKEGIPFRSTSRYIELSVLLLESICSEHKDEKILLTKSDINRIIDLETLFFQIFGNVFELKSKSKEEAFYENEVLVNYFKIMEKIVAIEPRIKELIASPERKGELVLRLFNECLFTMPSQEGSKEPICKNIFTRTAAFELLVELCGQNYKNLGLLFDGGLSTLSKNLPKIKAWNYTASSGRKSELGFAGIYNLNCICYMNAMLQQFYTTPTFRYGVLMCKDYVEENIVEVDERKVDDNIFHQLQRMFAYLDRSERKDYNPIDFCFAFKDFSGNPVNVNIQQDTQEFLNVFFDKLENGLKHTPYKNILKDVYGGKTINLIECSSCGHLRTREDLFYNLSLEVKNLKNINEGIEKLITEDIISDYKCENCLQKCDVIKRTLISECPNVLIVHLQRIIFDLDVLMNVKINTRYEFPHQLNLKDYTYDNYMKLNPPKPEAKIDLESVGEKKMSSEKLIDENEEIKEEPKEKIEAEPPKELGSEHFQYNLVGVLCHLGSAEVGHYYSYINVNRNDPRRPEKYLSL
jgi:ubiquitin carboxyl-terminal hydrolase 34